MNQLNLIPEERSRTHLAPSAVHIPDFLHIDDQKQMLELCRKGREIMGMERPWTGQFNAEGLPIHMKVRVMSFGWQWNLTEGYHPPALPIPDLITRLAEKAVLIAGLIPFVPVNFDSAIVQHYTANDSLEMHVDDSEDPALLKAGSPIVSFSLGDHCIFRFITNYGDQKIELRSGDAVVFGGESRLAEHGVSKILPNTALVTLGMKAAGRINITVRRAKA